MKQVESTLVLVSHDRTFLNGVSTDIIELTEQRLDYYRGTPTHSHTHSQSQQRASNAAHGRRARLLHTRPERSLTVVLLVLCLAVR